MSAVAIILIVITCVVWWLLYAVNHMLDTLRAHQEHLKSLERRLDIR